MKKKSPKIKLPKYPNGGLKGKQATQTYELDPLKWNQFQGWSRQQKTPSGESYVGNPKMDTNYEGGDKIDPQTLINQWNQLNPDKQITKEDILSAQKYSGTLKPDQWYGSQTSQYLYPSTPGGFRFPDNPKEGQQFNYPVTIGGKQYNQQASWKGGKPSFGQATPFTDSIPAFENGGEFRKGLNHAMEKTGQFLGNYGRGVADAGLGTIGLSNVIQDSDYQGVGANTFNKLGSTAGMIGNKVAPMALNMVVPGAGTALKGVQQVAGQFNPEDNQYSFGGNYNKPYNSYDQQSPSGNLIPLGKYTLMPTFPNGGTQVMGEDINSLTNEDLANLESRVAKLIKPNSKDTTYRDMWNLIANEKESRKLAIMNSQANPRPQKQVEVFPNGGKSFYPNGGNAEVEKQEVLQQPNGQVDQVNGPSHENGGVEVNIPNGTNIFSDRLKHPTIKKTFAKIAGKYTTKKEEKVLDDTKSDRLAKLTAKLMIDAKNKKLDQIFNEQESLKQSKVEKYAAKLGLKPTINKFPYGGNKVDQIASNDYSEIDGLDIQPNLRMYNEDGTYTSFDDGTNKARKPLLTLNSNQKDALTYGAGYLAQNLSNLSYLKDQGKKYDTQEFYNYTPSLISDKEQLRQADIEGKTAQQNIASGSGGNAGNYLANRVALASSLARTKAGIKENVANINAQIKNQGNQFNIANKYMTDDLTARNKGQTLSNYYQALTNVGQSGSDAYKDWRMTQMDRDKIQMLPKIYNILQTNPELLKLIESYGK